VPQAGVAASFDDLLADEALDAIAIATPAASRFQLAHRALEAGKHVLVESPLALRSDDAELLAARAGAGNLRLMAGHELPFHPGARRLRDLLSAGRLGELFYVCADRQGLGAHREEGVLWSAGAQAVALVLWLVGDEPIEASARGGAYGGGAPDVAFCHLRFATGIEAEVRLSSLEPRETRQLTVVTSSGMAILDELDAERALTLYERGATDTGGLDELGAEAERGDIVCPRLPVADTVLARCEHFVTAVRSPADAQDGAEGPAVVAVLQALQRSLDRGGAGEPLGTPDEPPATPAAPAGTPSGVPAGVIRFPLRSG
jgi:predicted dehydrogenase